jgi:membrane associated rhomboid family serine protease
LSPGQGGPPGGGDEHQYWDRPGGRWDLGRDDPRLVLARARTALFVMIGVIALLWLIQLANWADRYQLTFDFGIRPRDFTGLPDIVTAPFLHVSWAHIEGNSGPLFIFGFLAAYRGVAKFLWVTAVVVLTSGWLPGSPGPRARLAPELAEWSSATSATSWSAGSLTGTQSTC